MPTIPYAEFESFFLELRALVRRFRTLGERLHGEEALTLGQKSLLVELEANGPRTIPELSRSRPVSRQHVQVMIRELAEAGLVATRTNPAHRTSHFLELTPEGRARLHSLRQREQAALAALDLPFRPGEIRELAAGLQRVREAFEGLADRKGAPAEPEAH